MNPKELPIYELRDELTEALRSENRLLIEAPTGSGKSTQIPQMVLDGGAPRSFGVRHWPAAKWSSCNRGGWIFLTYEINRESAEKQSSYA